jgi:chromosome segregation ATPase
MTPSEREALFNPPKLLDAFDQQVLDAERSHCEVEAAHQSARNAYRDAPSDEAFEVVKQARDKVERAILDIAAAKSARLARHTQKWEDEKARLEEQVASGREFCNSFQEALAPHVKKLAKLYGSIAQELNAVRQIEKKLQLARANVVSGESALDSHRAKNPTGVEHESRQGRIHLAPTGPDDPFTGGFPGLVGRLVSNVVAAAASDGDATWIETKKYLP